jgi:hypothetical protein
LKIAAITDLPTRLATMSRVLLGSPPRQEHLSVKVRWDERSGQTHLVVSNSDTNPKTGKGWGDGEVDTRPGHKEHRVEVTVPLDWSEQDWCRVNDDKLQATVSTTPTVNPAGETALNPSKSSRDPSSRDTTSPVFA